ncbi:hypothetical protein F7725_017590 [Dissostichus mawsoni]|uniref:BHLH domain-containing protein n=1 Tax=Dissostichus mawsoni TaxID=36200 RepID=A0A7J5Z819_DISMA|nr:hypothetical protein F7725_017590 [Dissostichus mawsoni]
MAFTMLRPVSTHPFSYPADLTLISDDEEENRSESDGSTDQGYGCCGIPGQSYRLESGVVVPHRNAANARERHRTQNVNTAFTALRTLIPTEPVDRKLSKSRRCAWRPATSHTWPTCWWWGTGGRTESRASALSTRRGREEEKAKSPGISARSASATNGEGPTGLCENARRQWETNKSAMRGSEQDWIHSSEQTSGNLHKLFHKSGSISDSEDHFDFLLWLNVGSLKRIPAVGARRQPVSRQCQLGRHESESTLSSEGPAEPRSMAPKGPPMQEDVIDEQEGKGLIARPCRGSPCGARGPGSVPALTSVRAQMTPVLS